MRVLRVSHSAVVAEWRERERRLRDHGFEVRVMSARLWREFGVDVQLRPEAGEDVGGVRTWGSHPALFVYDPFPLWRELGRRWDVIDIHEEPYALATAEILLLRALRRNSAPYCLYSAQNIAKRYPPPFRWLERWALTRASAVSVCNDRAGQLVEDKGFPGVADRIPLGIDLAHFRPRPLTKGAPSLDVIVGYAGRLEPHKGVEVLLRALPGRERLVLRLAGDGPDRDRLRGLARTSGVESRVTFLGAVPQAGLPGFYRSVDVLAVPSLSTPGWVEQFGRVAVEAMACGTPVVATATGALPEVLAGAGRLVPERDPDALGDALLEVGTDAALRAQMRDAGLGVAAATSWDRVAARYASMYRRASHRATSEALAPEIDVVVVAYGAPALLARALTPLRGMAVIVVDNSSSADVRRVCEEADAAYVDAGHNRGFAAGVNEGLRHRRHPDSDVLLLNPDASIGVEEVYELQRVLRLAPDLASVGPSQRDDRGRPSRVVWPFPSPWRAWLDAVGLGGVAARDDYVIGSVLLLRAEAIEQVGGFDEGFFLYAEETDWARRAARLGWRHEVVPHVEAVHTGGATSADESLREQRFHASLERYLRKHHGVAGWHVARWAILTGSVLRGLVLPGERGRDARKRATLYLRGSGADVRAERRGTGP